MEVQIKDNSGQVALATAGMIKKQLNEKPDSLLCIAAGHTQLETLNILTDWYRCGELGFDCCRIIGLDEWVGLPGDLPGTCSYFLRTNILTPMNVSSERCFLFDGCADDPDAQCIAANNFLNKYGPIDLIVLGVGMNAHLGFNEPGINENLRTHVIELDDTTRTVSTKYFQNTVAITHGITLGLRDILAATTLIVQATGENKSTIVKQICEGEITNSVPASLVRRHANAVMLIDNAAAS